MARLDKRLERLVAQGVLTPEQRDAILADPDREAGLIPSAARAALLPFGPMPLAALARPVAGLVIALAVAALLMAGDVLIDDLTDTPEPPLVTAWAPAAAAILLLVAGTLRARGRETFLTAGLVLAILHVFLDARHAPWTMAVSVGAAALVLLVEMPAGVRVVAAAAAVPVLLLVGYSMPPGTAAVAQLVLTGGFLVLFAAVLPAGSPWRNLPYCGLAAIGVVLAVAGFLALRYWSEVEQGGGPGFDTAILVVSGPVVLRLVWLWPRRGWDARLRLPAALRLHAQA